MAGLFQGATLVMLARKSWVGVRGAKGVRGVKGVREVSTCLAELPPEQAAWQRRVRQFAQEEVGSSSP